MSCSLFFSTNLLVRTTGLRSAAIHPLIHSKLAFPYVFARRILAAVPCVDALAERFV